MANVQLPVGKIGNIKISRLICGGNLIIGSAHDRDLIYMAALMRAYFTDAKIIQTWQLCEECGVNTMIGPVNSPYAYGEDPTLRVLKRYREEFGGRIQWIAQTYPKSSLARSRRLSTTARSGLSSTAASPTTGSGSIASTCSPRRLSSPGRTA
jgi:hypothetical protein